MYTTPGWYRIVKPVDISEYPEWTIQMDMYNNFLVYLQDYNFQCYDHRSSSYKIFRYNGYSFNVKWLVKGESKTKGEGMLGVIKSVVSEVGNFFKENRQVLYWMVIIFLFDKFFLGGTLKNRLTNVCKKLVDKLESDVTK